SSLSICVWTSITVMRVSSLVSGLRGRFPAAKIGPGRAAVNRLGRSADLGAGEARRRRVARRHGGGRRCRRCRGGAGPHLQQRLPPRARLAVPAMADLALEGVGIGADRLVDDGIVLPEQREL